MNKVHFTYLAMLYKFKKEPFQGTLIGTSSHQPTLFFFLKTCPFLITDRIPATWLVRGAAGGGRRERFLVLPWPWLNTVQVNQRFR